MKQREVLLHCALLTLPYVQGGLLALMPVHAARLGASPAVAGYYVALCFLTLAIGSARALNPQLV